MSRSSILTSAVLILLLTLCLGFAAIAVDFQGNYECIKSERVRGRDYKVKYTLIVHDRDRVEIVSEAVGEVPPAQSEYTYKFGEILYYLRNDRRVVHEGTWYESRDRLIMTMRYLDGRRVTGEYHASLDRDRLRLYRYDTRLYGYGEMQFTRARKSSITTKKVVVGAAILGALWYLAKKNSDRDKSPDDYGSDAAGVYEANRTWRQDGRNYGIRHTLRLDRNKRAELTTEPDGYRVPIDRSSVREYGEILYFLQNERGVVHQGAWEQRGSQVILKMTTLDRERVEGSYTLNISRNGLSVKNIDTEFYGRSSFEFTKQSEYFTPRRSEPSCIMD